MLRTRQNEMEAAASASTVADKITAALCHSLQKGSVLGVCVTMLQLGATLAVVSLAVSAAEPRVTRATAAGNVCRPHCSRTTPVMGFFWGGAGQGDGRGGGWGLFALKPAPLHVGITLVRWFSLASCWCCFVWKARLRSGRASAAAARFDSAASHPKLLSATQKVQT